MPTVLIAGGTGFIGTRLSKHLKQQGYEVRILTRKPVSPGEYYWDPLNRQIDGKALEGVDCIINLAGAGIADKRWTESRKSLLIESRVQSALVLADAIHRLETKPAVYISASAVGYYGNSGDTLMHESDLPVDESFMVRCCRAWEDAAGEVQQTGIRTVILRIGIALAPEGGAQKALEQTMRFGFGVQFGGGKAWWPWIHIDDLCHIFQFALENTGMEGAYNAVAPEPLQNRSLIKALAKRRKFPVIIIPAPAFLFRLIFGEMSATILNSNRISAEKLLRAGFKFRHPQP